MDMHVEKMQTTKSIPNILYTTGRIATLPATISNCIAGWWLAEPGDISKFLCFLLGVTLVHIASGFINDACDFEIDEQFKPFKPIPSGLLTQKSSWVLATVLLTSGFFITSTISKLSGFAVFMMIYLILLYNIIHKIFTFSPLIHGSIRFFLYLAAAGAAEKMTVGSAIWAGFAMLFYTSTFHYYLQNKRISEPFNVISTLTCVFAPLLFAWIFNGPGYRSIAFIFALVLTLWTWFALSKIKHNCSNLNPFLATGIILTDLLAIGPSALELIIVYLPLLILAGLLPKLNSWN